MDIDSKASEQDKHGERKHENSGQQTSFSEQVETKFKLLPQATDHASDRFFLHSLFPSKENGYGHYSDQLGQGSQIFSHIGSNNENLKQDYVMVESGCKVVVSLPRVKRSINTNEPSPVNSGTPNNQPVISPLS